MISNNSSLLWKISKKNYPNSYLFGTIHAIPKEMFLLTSKVNQALLSCNTLYIEIDLQNTTDIELSPHLMKSEKSLQDYISENEYQLVSAVIKEEFQYDISLFTHLKPIFILTLLLQSKMPKNIIRVEDELIQLASSYNLNIKGLSTIYEQYNFGTLAISYTDLIESIAKMSHWNISEMLYELFKSYKEENLIDMEKNIQLFTFDNTNSYKILVEDRNEVWVNRLKDLLITQSLFIAIGAGHLLGKKGLIELLKDKGFAVKPII